MLVRTTTTKCHPPTGSFVPFLYQTKTILRHFTPGPKHSRAGDYESDAGKRKYNRQDGSRSRDDDADREPQESRTIRPSSKPRSTAERISQPRPIPFEGQLPTTSLGARVEGSTMTPKELRIFEQLFKAKQVQADENAPSTQKRRKGYKTESKRYGVAAPQSSREFPDLLRPLAQEAAALRARAAMEENKKTNDEVTTPTRTEDDPAARSLQTIKAEMDQAKTDIALWNVLQHQIFQNVRALSEPSKSGKVGRNFQVLTQTLPQSLLYFMKTIRDSFPGSSLGLVLLPTLKKLGPSAFALGASTELFNEHMWLLYKHYADLDNIAETLSEMDKNVYEFDGGTKDLIATILRDGHKALKNNYGPGLQALWSTDRKTRGLEKIRRWEGIVEERLKAAALRDAMAEQTQVVGDEDEDTQRLAAVA